MWMSCHHSCTIIKNLKNNFEICNFISSKPSLYAEYSFPRGDVLFQMFSVVFSKQQPQQKCTSTSLAVSSNLAQYLCKVTHYTGITMTYLICHWTRFMSTIKFQVHKFHQQHLANRVRLKLKTAEYSYYNMPQCYRITLHYGNFSYS